MQYDFSLNPYGGGDISAKGQYIKYKKGLGDIRVRFSSGGYVDLSVGQGVRVDKEFSSVNLTDKSGATNVGVLVVGNVDFQDDSIAGTVNIVDNSVATTLADKCFLGTLQGTSSAAANYAAHYLTNPAGSGKNVVVQSVSLTSGVASIMSVHALASGAGGGAVSAVNKNVASGGGTPSQAKLWKFDETASVFGLLGPAMKRRTVNSNTEATMRFAEPIVIRPGVTLAVIYGNAVISSVFVDFEFREEPV